MKYTLRTATEDSPIFKRGFVISPPNYGQDLERSKAKSLEDTDGQKGRSSQSTRIDFDDGQIQKTDLTGSKVSAKTNMARINKNVAQGTFLSWVKLLSKIFSDKFFKKSKKNWS